MMHLVDSHVHFWDPQTLHYGWLEGLPTLNHPFLPADFATQGEGWHMDALVFVQADCDDSQGVQEAAWVSSLAEQDSRIQGIVAFAPLEQGEGVRPILEQLKKYPLVKGIRRLIQSEGAGFCLQPGFVRGVQILADYDFSFDICIRHYQLADAASLVRQCPNINFVLDHIGKPGIKAGLMNPWKEDIKRLAALPNVICKLSGLLTEADLQNWSREDFAPYVQHVLDTFRTGRVMYGSDTPVVRLAERYDDWLAMVLEIASGQPENGQALMADTAKHFYRL